jgi:hypothetical protein
MHTKLEQTIPNAHNLHITYTKWPNNITNIPQNTPTFFITMPSKVYPNCYFCSENTPSGNRGKECCFPETSLADPLSEHKEITILFEGVSS